MEKEITQKLSIGLIIKNYKEVCKILGVKATKGKGRKYHIRELERYCNYIKEGHKFIITEVFDEVIEKIDNRSTGKNSKYDELMDNIIINLLIENKNIDESYTYLMNNYFNFFTTEYNKLNKVGYKRYSKINKMSKGLVMTYQEKTNSIVKGCLETSLNRLKRKEIIEFKNNTVVLNLHREKSFADTKTLHKISELEKEVYKEMDIIPFNRINPNINTEFKSKVCEELDIFRYWKVYSFELIDPDIEKVEEDTSELIQRFIKSVHNAVINKESKKGYSNKFKPYGADKFKDDLNNLERLIWNLPENYISEYEKQQELYKEMERLFCDELETVPF